MGLFVRSSISLVLTLVVLASAPWVLGGRLDVHSPAASTLGSQSPPLVGSEAHPVPVRPLASADRLARVRPHSPPASSSLYRWRHPDTGIIHVTMAPPEDDGARGYPLAVEVFAYRIDRPRGRARSRIPGELGSVADASGRVQALATGNRTSSSSALSLPRNVDGILVQVEQTLERLGERNRLLDGLVRQL